MKVLDNPFQQPDVSKVTPLPVSNGRSDDCIVVYINGYGRYQRVEGYWDDVSKCFYETSSGRKITEEIVRTENLKTAF